MQPVVTLLLLSSMACSEGLIVGAGTEEQEEAGADAAMAAATYDAGLNVVVDAASAQPKPDASPPAPDAGPSVDPGEPTALQGITNAHNEARALKGLAPMVWDDDLAAIAQAWTNTCTWGHNAGRSNGYPGYVGENMYASSAPIAGPAPVQSWISEETNYNYETNTCSGTCGHYTQVVWAQSLRVGCAVTYCPNATYAYILACDYSPGGNVNGARPY